jgi:hypothetical protein
MVHDTPTKTLQSQANPKKLMEELNQLGSEGWRVVATLEYHTGISSHVVLERAKTTPETA